METGSWVTIRPRLGTRPWRSQRISSLPASRPELSIPVDSPAAVSRTAGEPMAEGNSATARLRPVSVPEAVTGSHTFELITAGGFSIGHTCALNEEGEAYCWGDNERGQLGNGSGGFGEEDLSPHPTPSPVTGAPAFVSMTAGPGRHTCGLTGAGAAYCWGENSFGALGDGSTGDRAAPVAVSGGLAFQQVTAGGFIGHTCGLISGGTAYCWGENSVGQVGDNSTNDRLVPSAVSGGLSFTILDAGFRHPAASRPPGSVLLGLGWCRPAGHQLDDPTLRCRPKFWDNPEDRDRSRPRRRITRLRFPCAIGGIAPAPAVPRND